MTEVVSNIYFEHDDKEIVRKLEFLFGDHKNDPSNEEYDQIFDKLNPEILKIVKATNNGHKNLEWLEGNKQALKDAKYMLDFDELPDNYRIWLDFEFHYSEAFSERELTKKGKGYEIYSRGKIFAILLIIKILELSGAKNISYDSYEI